MGFEKTCSPAEIESSALSKISPARRARRTRREGGQRGVKVLHHVPGVTVTLHTVYILYSMLVYCTLYLYTVLFIGM